MAHILSSPHPSPHPLISGVFGNSRSGRCEVIPHCSFDVYFPGDHWRWTSFNVPVGKLHVFEKTSTQSLYLFLNWFFFLLLLNCRSSWYVLDINPLSGIRFGNLFMLLHGLSIPLWRYSVQFSSVAQSCPTLCDPMNHSTPGLITNSWSSPKPMSIELVMPSDVTAGL